jgi:hypothetical protein
MGSGAGALLFRIVDSLVDCCFPIVDHVIGNVEKLEGTVFRALVPETVRDIMFARGDMP